MNLYCMYVTYVYVYVYIYIYMYNVCVVVVIHMLVVTGSVSFPLIVCD